MQVNNKYYKYIRLYVFLLIGCLLSSSCFEFNKNNHLFTKFDKITTNNKQINFRQAKSLAKLIYQDHNFTFYCNCKYIHSNNQVDLQSCGYKVQNSMKRASRLEWEHIMPASFFGGSLPCWNQLLCSSDKNHKYKGRLCCQKIDPNFAKIEADLHNIVPIIGELNALRSNYDFAELPEIENNRFGTCTIKIDKKTRQIDPPEETKGMVARTYLYMSQRYKISLTRKQKKIFSTWNKKYPPTNWEIYRNKIIKELQNNDNTYVSAYR